jgi:hypothetical protein
MSVNAPITSVDCRTEARSHTHRTFPDGFVTFIRFTFRAREGIVTLSLGGHLSMCRWPIGDPAQPDFRFCGAKKLPGEGPYCACHAGIAYQTQHNRRREPRSQRRLA